MFLKITIICLVSLGFLYGGVRGDCSYCLSSGQTYSDSNTDIVNPTPACGNFNYFFNQTSSSCMAEVGLNKTCDANVNNCQYQYTCYAESGSDNPTCQPLRSLQVGEACNDHEAYCVSGYCTGKCQETDTCSQDSDCAYNRFCLNGACADHIALGGDCESDGSCGLGNFCNNAGVCQELFTVPENGECSTVSQCDISQNLYCNGGVCTKYTKSSSTENCATNVYFSCNDNEWCDCVSGTCKSAVVLSNATAQASKDYFSCLVKNQCSQYTAVIPEACIMKQCGAEYCNLIQQTTPPCQVSDIYSTPLCSPFKVTPAPTDPSSSNQLQILSLLSLISFILLIIN